MSRKDFELIAATIRNLFDINGNDIGRCRLGGGQ